MKMEYLDLLPSLSLNTAMDVKEFETLEKNLESVDLSEPSSP